MFLSPLSGGIELDQGRLLLACGLQGPVRWTGISCTIHPIHAVEVGGQQPTGTQSDSLTMIPLQRAFFAVDSAPVEWQR